MDCLLKSNAAVNQLSVNVAKSTSDFVFYLFIYLFVFLNNVLGSSST